jgi:hypothetical protein
MLDYTNAVIKKISLHHVGNKTNGEDLYTSKSPIDPSAAGLAKEDQMQDLLKRFFLQPFNNQEYYSFTFTNEDFSLNPVYNFAVEVFENARKFHGNTVNIAKHLYELSVHPQIKSGDLFVAHLTNLTLDNEDVEALGIFKSENRQDFIKTNQEQGEFTIEFEDGISIDKLDKGCLIFNVEQENGFKISIVDRANRSSEAQFWKNDFLMLKPLSDAFHQTKNFLDIAKNYVSKQFVQEFEVTKTDQIDLLNKSVEYFKSNENFDKKKFEKEVFQDAQVIKSFRNYDEMYRDDHNLEIEDEFEISTHAVKKQSRIFKSVLKLDKNFHIYIHGDKELIEQGVEKDGRKYYKIYYKEEK